MQQEKKPACRPLRCLAKCAGAFLLLAIIAFVGSYLYLSHDLESTLEELDRDGYATHPRNLAPPPVPAEESTTEAYKSALDALSEIPFPERFWEQPNLALLPESDRAEFQAWLQENREIIDAIESAGDPRKCRFGWKYEEGFAMEMEELSPVIKAARATCLRAKFSSLTGNQDKARKSLSAAIDLYLLFESEPLLVCQLVRIVVHEMIFNTINQAITVDTSEKELEAWLKFIEGVPPIEGSIELGYRGELAFFALMLRDPSMFLSHERMESEFEWRTLAPLAWLDGAYGLRQFKRLIELSKLPSLEAIDGIGELETEMSQNNRWLYPLTSLMFPSAGRTKINEASAECHRLLVRTGILCELARLREGKYPDAIEGIDPLTGKSFDYSPADGWIRTRQESLRAEEEMDIEKKLTWKLRQGK